MQTIAWPRADFEAIGLDLDAHGRAGRPLVVVDLDALRTAPSKLASEIAASVRAQLMLTIGVATQHVPATLEPVLDALDLSYVPTEHASARTAVPAADPWASAEALTQSVRRSPCAAVALGRLLRTTSVLDVLNGLSAEAAVYSMLLAGEEFKRWLLERGPARPAPDVRAERVLLARTGPTLRIILNRPQRRNAFDAAMREALLDALAVAASDPTILDVRIDGAGPDFCSGGDLDEFGAASDVVAAYFVRLDRHTGWMLYRLGDRARVRLHGACIGAGVEISAFAGTVVAKPTTMFRLPEVAMGLIPGAGGTVSITRRIGRWRTAWLALTGTTLDARTALEWGLVDALEDE